MKRIVLLVLFAVASVGFLADNGFTQGRQRQRRRPESTQEKAVPRREAPRPPQRYNPHNRNYRRQYYYGGSWYRYTPRPYRYNYRGRHRVAVCQPGYVIFLGYDYRGRPLFDFYLGHCNVLGHRHNYYWYRGY